MSAVTDLRSFLRILEKENELAIINCEVDPHLEVAEIHRRAVRNQGKALLFRNVKNSAFPIVTNLFGSQKRMELAFPGKPEKMVQDLVKLLTTEFPPSLSTLWKNRRLLTRGLNLGTKKRYPHECVSYNLNDLPILKCWPEDGGHFITLPLVYTESRNGTPPNLGMYRIQRFSKDTTGLHFQIGKGGGFHFREAELQNENLPVTIFLGGPPALMLAAIAPLPENVPELLFASLILGKKLDLSLCEFAIQGHAKPHVRRIEGPFGDHFGYYDRPQEFPVFHLEKIAHRKNAIYPATVVGKPPQEDLFIGDFLQELFTPLIQLSMPGIKSLWSYSETGFHPLAAAVVRERYEKEALGAAFRILGEGQLQLTKCLLITDRSIDLKNAKLTLETVLERFRPEEDLHIFGHTANDTLDYTGPKLNRGSKMILIGTGEKRRDLPSSFTGPLPSYLTSAIPFCRGCLAVDGNIDPQTIANDSSLAAFPLIVLVDNAKQATSTTLEFLWTLFTRFEPAADIYTAHQTIRRHQIAYQLPIVIDARMKAHYPKEALPDEATELLVDRRWNEYGL